MTDGDPDATDSGRDPPGADDRSAGTGPSESSAAPTGSRSTGESGDAPDAIDHVDPSAYTTDRRSISGAVRILWAIRVVVVAIVAGGLATTVAGAFEPIPTWVGGALGLAIVVFGIPWVHMRYLVWAYEVREDSLYLERGVLTHVRTIAPFVRIQHVDTQRGPLERALGLSTLVVYTAGSRGADVSVPGLRPEEASDLQKRVKGLAIEAEGGDAV